MVRALGWKLHTYGIGINGKELARKMGFDEDLAITVEASVQGIETSTRGYSQATRRPRP